MMKTPTSSLRASASLRSAIALASAILASAVPIQAASVTWSAGGGADLDWSNSSNWGGLTPSGNDLVFGTDGATTSPTTVTSVVDSNVSASSLSFLYDSVTQYQGLQINDGVTLSLGGSANVFTVGGYFLATPTTTQAVIAGGGALAINQAGGNFLVSNNNTGTSAGVADLDMSGLRNLSVDLGSTGSFNIGTSSPTTAAPATQISIASVRLAEETQLTGGTLRVGSTIQNTQITVSRNNSVSVLQLGEQNELNFDLVQIGRGFTSTVNGLVQFDPTVSSDATVRLRGSNGVSAVSSLLIGVNEGGGSSTLQTGVLDFTGGTVDALVNKIVLGSGQASSTGKADGTLTMNRGKIIATDIIAGEAETGTSSQHEGTINIAGGSLTANSLNLGVRISGTTQALGSLNISGNGSVTINGNINVGNATGATTAGAFTGNITISGGSLNAGGNIAEAGNKAFAHSSVTLQGGVLDMRGHNIDVDTFVAEGGRLQNVNSLTVNGTASGLTKSGAGVLTLAGTNSFTGGVTVSGGVLLLNDGALPETGSVTVNSGGAIAFDTTGSVQSALAASRIDTSSAGAIALTQTQGGESLDFSASGANLATAFLGSLGEVKYSGEFNPNGSVYRLGGGSGTLHFASDIEGSSSVVIGGGSGAVQLEGNNSYSGGTTISSGTLRLSSVSEIGAADGALTFDGGTLQWGPGSVADVTAGRTVTLNAGGGKLGVQKDNAVSLSNAIGGEGGLTKTGLGTLTLQGENTYTGSTRIQGGRLVADLSTNNTGVISSSSALVLEGGRFELKGKSGSASSQTLASLTLGASTGNSIVVTPNGATSTILTIGNSWTRNTGSSLLIDLSLGGSVASAPVTSVATPTAAANVLGYTVVKDATGYGFGVVQNSNIVRYASAIVLPTDSVGSTNNYLTSGDLVQTGARSIRSLTIDTTSGAGSLDMGAVGNRLSLSSGGLLMYGSHDFHFSRGILGTSAGELIVHQYGTGTLTVSGTISSGAASLTKAGSGLLVLAGTSAYTGATSVNDGTLRVDGAIGATNVTVGDATFTVNGSAGGSVSMRESARLNGTGSIAGDVALTGLGTISSSGTLKIAGGLDIRGNNNILSSGTVAVNGATVIHSNSSLTVDGVLGNRLAGISLSGRLDGAGTVNKNIFINTEGSLSGNLTVNGVVSGGGSINPGNSPGLLTATEIDASQGLSFNFEFNALDGINWSSLDNDVLRLTSGDNPFSSALDSTNTVSLYLSASIISDLADGGSLIGGFYADSGDFLASIENANYRAFYEDAGGSILYNGVTYSEYTLGAFGVSTVQNAHFAANGYITQFQMQVIPEPSTIALFSAGFVGLAMRALRRKKA